MADVLSDGLPVPGDALALYTDERSIVLDAVWNTHPDDAPADGAPTAHVLILLPGERVEYGVALLMFDQEPEWPTILDVDTFGGIVQAVEVWQRVTGGR